MPWGMPQMPSFKGSKGCAKGSGRDPSIRKVFVGGLPHVPSEDGIRDFFAQFGPIEEVKMMYGSGGESKGYCFITFASAEAAGKVFDNYDDNLVDGKWVDCKPADGGKTSKPGDWICPMCGDLVFAKRTSCNMCGFGDGMPGLTAVPNGQKPGDWICQNCGDLVFSYRDKCNKCGASKSRSVQRLGTKKGDWACPGCGDLVFASKDACTMCGTPKPDEDDDKGPYGARGRRYGAPPPSRPY
mmetsp:Transcript_32516/g.101438  ORF Transcript_32516/g.101438 Transcript_32516/m.101438 type:complete len:241 (-) Transcript_32516:65-787(-)